MSVSPHTTVIIAAGVLAGLILAVLPLWWQHRAAALARWQATHDDVTGLPNRRAVLTLLHRAARDSRPHGLVLLDLDRFKTVNDTYGHEAGNHLLVHVGARLAALPPPVALAARLSGDEFALLVYGDPVDVQAAAHTAWHAVRAEPCLLGDHTVPVQASVGYAYAEPRSDPRDLLHAADLAMYRAKTRATHGTRLGPAPPAPQPKPPGRCRDWPRP